MMKKISSGWGESLEQGEAAGNVVLSCQTCHLIAKSFLIITRLAHCLSTIAAQLVILLHSLAGIMVIPADSDVEQRLQRRFAL
jgi:hypothetical protein